jgi:hypothetical protein
MTNERKIAYEPHPVLPSRKAELRAAGCKIIDARFDPDRQPALAPETAGNGLGPESGDQFSDEQLRAAIEAATGKAPHHKLGREKLIEQFNKINTERKARQDEEASNGLTRREIEADLTAMHVDFDPRDPLEDLAALRDLHREQRQ